VRVHLPGCSSAAQLELEISSQHIQLTFPSHCYLDLHLPYPVDEDKGTARFDTVRQQLHITLPVVHHLCANLPSGCGSSAHPGRQALSSSSTHHPASPKPVSVAAKQPDPPMAEVVATCDLATNSTQLSDPGAGNGSPAVPDALAEQLDDQHLTENQRQWKLLHERRLSEQSSPEQQGGALNRVQFRQSQMSTYAIHLCMCCCVTAGVINQGVSAISINAGVTKRHDGGGCVAPGDTATVSDGTGAEAVAVLLPPRVHCHLLNELD